MTGMGKWQHRGEGGGDKGVDAPRIMSHDVLHDLPSHLHEASFVMYTTFNT